MAENKSSSASLTVFYDGSCPLCLREVKMYRKRTLANEVAWIDVSDPVAFDQAADGLSCDQAMARFHVKESDKLYSGAHAFVRLWAHVPGFRWLGRLMDNAPAIWIGERCYHLFLKFRPGIQRLVRRLERA